ncbi:hypothetical protein [Aquabacterium sp. OR-4]|uniref:hypothetical protein n=1 Tax=Aquabacterium sp. OR-4 TaxID=2978127 RepID=UPI0021B1F3DA|nr:hypothetical protein [Aquabacterium sp. OR-4]MDT7836204.1 hypothetical protein [Aquabacterium sp. OR-4]
MGVEAPNPATVWTAHAELLHWREVDGEWLVHDAGASQVHLLDALTAAVLDQLQSAPSDAAGLQALLGPAMPEIGPLELASAVEAALAKLRGVGLIEAPAP